MAKIGRNDPCPCGSGKKYKKCCLNKNRKEEMASPRVQAKIKSKKKDIFEEFEERFFLEMSHPKIKSKNKHKLKKLTKAQLFWKNFEESEYEDQIKLYLERIEESYLDPDLAFEMVSNIRNSACQKNDRLRFMNLVKQLQEKHPKTYSKDINYYNSYLIEDAIFCSQIDLLSELLDSFAKNPEDSIDIFFRMIDFLMYHDQTKPLLEAMKRAWSIVKDSYEIMVEGIREFGDIAINLIIFQFLDESKDIKAEDINLQKAITLFAKLDANEFEEYLYYLKGVEKHIWKKRDINPKLNKNNWERMLFLLTVEFMGEIHRNTGIPLSRLDLGLTELIEYLIEQGESKNINVDEEFSFWFQRKTLDKFLVRFFDFLCPRLNRAGAVIEVLPDFLHFIAKCGLITKEEYNSKIKEIKVLKDTVIKALNNYNFDPILVRNIQDRWDLYE